MSAPAAPKAEEPAAKKAETPANTLQFVEGYAPKERE